MRASVNIEPALRLTRQPYWPVPRRQQHLVLAWAELHLEELLANWDRAVHEDTLHRIKGLE
jgi:hypothetical protein